MALTLVKPAINLIPSYLEALREGNFVTMQPGFGNDAPEDIERDPAAYLAKVNAPAPFTFKFKNGREARVTEHELLWITDGPRFLGTVALRYRGDPEMLDVYAGHIGLAIRPALLNRGYGPRAIGNLRDELAKRAAEHGLDFVYATCNVDNRASARLIEFFGGILEEKTEDTFGHGPNMRYKIMVDQKHEK